jgi:hypothetical protein
MVLPATDLIIGGCALQAAASVVTVDSHFASIPGLNVRSDLPDLGYDGTDAPEEVQQGRKGVARPPSRG